MRQSVELPLAGPVFERALLLAREAVTTAILGGGPGAEAALEPVLTEATNDRLLGALVSFLLMSVAGSLAVEVASADLELDGIDAPTPEAVGERAVEILDEVVGAIRDTQAADDSTGA